MKKSDLITHISLAMLTFIAMLPSIAQHGTSLNLSIYMGGVGANVVLAGIYYYLRGAKI